MRNKIENYWNKIKVRVFNSFSIKKKDTKLKREIELLKSQVASLSEIVQEQSNIVVAIAKIQADAQTIADKLAAVEKIVIATKVSATGVIYGSVNSLQVSEKLKEQGIEITESGNRFFEDYSKINNMIDEITQRMS